MHFPRIVIRWVLALPLLFLTLAAEPAPKPAPISPAAFAVAVTPSAFAHLSLGYVLKVAGTPTHALYPAAKAVWEHKRENGHVTALWMVTYIHVPHTPPPSTWTPGMLSQWSGFQFATQLHTHFSNDSTDQNGLSGLMPGVRIWNATPTIGGRSAIAIIEAWHFGTMLTLSELVTTLDTPVIAGESVFNLPMATYLGEKDWLATHPGALAPT